MITDDKLTMVVRRILGGLVGVGLSFCLAGCSDGDFSDLNKYIAEIKARPKSAIEPLPEIKVVEPFLFNGDNLRDPFTAVAEHTPDDLTDSLGGPGVKPDPLHQKEDLEHYPLDALRMVGTMNIDSVLWGLIKVNVTDVAGKDGGLGTVHRVKVGNYMGEHYGKILRIVEDKIELMEIVPDKPGTWREQEQELPLVLAE
ncbi:MAG: pilus assembly protein PilP [Methylococcaceae bacterium]|nr:pilus assembly protein PilP [Methylococcaceae bacterium]